MKFEERYVWMQFKDGEIKPIDIQLRCNEFDCESDALFELALKLDCLKYEDNIPNADFTLIKIFKTRW